MAAQLVIRDGNPYWYLSPHHIADSFKSTLRMTNSRPELEEWPAVVFHGIRNQIGARVIHLLEEPWSVRLACAISGVSRASRRRTNPIASPEVLLAM